MMNAPQIIDPSTDLVAVELAKTGVPLRQLINMLEAAYSQGARYVLVGKRMPDATGQASAIDWVSPTPCGGVVYVGAHGPDIVMSNQALESLDW